MFYNINPLSLHRVFHGIRFKVYKDWLPGGNQFFFWPYWKINKSNVFVRRTTGNLQKKNSKQSHAPLFAIVYLPIMNRVVEIFNRKACKEKMKNMNKKFGMWCKIYNFTRELKSALIHLYDSVRKTLCNVSI